MADFVYRSIAVVEIQPDNNVSIETLAISEKECTLSGAWEFEIEQLEEIQNVINGRLVLTISNRAEFKKFISDPSIVYLDIDEFIAEAKKAVEDAIHSLEEFKLKDLNKRKKLLTPEFFDWPDNIDFNSSIEILERMGKMSTPHNTPLRMRKILAASRLLKFLIEMWHSDELERKNRRYLNGDAAAITILPNCWLAH